LIRPKEGKLSTYAAWWIKPVDQARHWRNQSKTIRLPVHLVDKISKMRRGFPADERGARAVNQPMMNLATRSGIASGKSLAAQEPYRSAQLRSMHRSATMILLNSARSSGDEEAQTPFELLRDKNLRNEVGGLLDVLDDREKKIIFQRFGLDGGKPKTLEEVGKKFGVYTRGAFGSCRTLHFRSSAAL